MFYCVHVHSNNVYVCACVCVIQGKFKMILKAQRMIGNSPVCQMDADEKEGTIRVKPTTFNEAANIKASVFCPTCECEKVDPQIVSEAHIKMI